MRDRLQQEYQKRADGYRAEQKNADRIFNQLTYLRLGVFGAGAILGYLVLSAHFLGGMGVIALFIIAFFVVVKRHAVVDERRDHFRHLKEVNEQELAVIAGDQSSLESGKRFIDSKHDYSYDLDLFGDRSVFQYLNRTSSALGLQRLADWFKIGLSNSQEILDRQEAVRDLSQRLDFRQEFQAIGNEKLENEEGQNSLENWLKEPPYYLGHPYYKFLIYLLPALFVLLSVLTFFIEPLSWHFPVGLLIVNLFVVRQNLERVVPTHAHLGKRFKVLDRYGDLLRLVEKESFTSPQLQAEQARLQEKGENASESIKQLASVARAFDQRLNIFAGFVLNALILWDLHCMFRLEKWKSAHRDQLAGWFEVLADFDALISLGGFAYNHPDFSFPIINEDDFVMKGDALGHVLLDPAKRVDNDFGLEGEGQHVIVTGANMAGKSTFLRTVGVNLILAMMGAPVCAKRFEFHPVQLYTSVRATDSLQDNESYFYAELVRLKAMIDRLKSGQRLFVIIDEMLRGTNSRDKQTGSRGLILQLIHLKSMGLIATHDLSLGTLKDEYPDLIRNLRFEIDITGDQLRFDYKLQEGISQNLNATFLMKKMGIME